MTRKQALRAIFPLMFLLLVSCTGDSPRKSGEPPLAPTDTGNNTPSSPDAFQVKFETSKGDFLVEVNPSWSPLGAKQFRKLVESKFYDGCRFFRVVPDFMVQFGINGDPSEQKYWRDQRIKDDPKNVRSNQRGYITFATSGPDSRTTQVFINFKNNRGLDDQGFTPFGKVIEGMDVVDSIESKYREQPNQGAIQNLGNEYLNGAFPDLDYIKTARIVEKEAAEKTGKTPAKTE